MSYIITEKRLVLDPTIDNLHHALVELEIDDDENNMEESVNYAITRLLMMVYGNDEATTYSQINDAIGVLECAKLEFYRQVAAKHENQKRHDEGGIERFKEPGEVVGQVEVRDLHQFTKEGRESG